MDQDCLLEPALGFVTTIQQGAIARHNGVNQIVLSCKYHWAVRAQWFRPSTGSATHARHTVVFERNSFTGSIFFGSPLRVWGYAVSMVPSLCDGVPLFSSGSAEEGKLNRVFQKRHPITHNLGVVDRKHLERVRSGEAEGTEVRIEKSEIVETARLTDSVLSEFHRKLFPAAPA